METQLKETKFIDKFIDDIFVLGNHHYYGLFKDSFQERGNELLSRSKQYLLENININDEEKYKIKCLQYWIVGFLSGQHLTIDDNNAIH